MAATGPPRRGPFMNRAANSQPRRRRFRGARSHGKTEPMRAILLTGLLALSACRGEAPAADPAAPANNAADPAQPAAKAFRQEEKTDLLSWSLSYPAEVAAIPKLAESIRAASLKDKAENLASAKSDKAQRAENDFPFHPYEQSDSYEVEGNSGRLLSLSVNWYVFTGGAHPNHGTRALLWDRDANGPIAFAGLLSGGASALQPLFGKAYCAALDKQRAERRGPDNSSVLPDDPFDKCPEFGELAIIPKGQNGKPFDKILVHADPYVAGPYAEGDYDVELPVTAELIAALKPEYRASFAKR